MKKELKEPQKIGLSFLFFAIVSIFKAIFLLFAFQRSLKNAPDSASVNTLLISGLPRRQKCLWIRRKAFQKYPTKTKHLPSVAVGRVVGNDEWGSYAVFPSVRSSRWVCTWTRREGATWCLCQRDNSDISICVHCFTFMISVFIAC